MEKDKIKNDTLFATAKEVLNEPLNGSRDESKQKLEDNKTNEDEEAKLEILKEIEESVGFWNVVKARDVPLSESSFVLFLIVTAGIFWVWDKFGSQILAGVTAVLGVAAPLIPLIKKGCSALAKIHKYRSKARKEIDSS